MTKHLIGMDEVGWGPGAGPLVVVACYIVPEALEEVRRWGVTDSKLLKNKGRTPYDGPCDRVAQRLVTEGDGKVFWASSVIEPIAFDTFSPMACLLTSYRNAVCRLLATQGWAPSQAEVILDGSVVVNTFPPSLAYRTEPKADANYLQAAAASILAKSYRDTIMRLMDRTYPAYGFGGHSGYINQDHLDAFWKHGPIPGVHRLCYFKKQILKRAEQARSRGKAVPAWMSHLGWDQEFPPVPAPNRPFTSVTNFAAAVNELLTARTTPP